MNVLKELGKTSIVYGLGGAFTKGIPFLLLPVYTRIFNPTEYGQIEMMTVISALLSAILIMGLDSAQSFYFFEQEKKGKSQQKKIISAILQWRIIWGLTIILISAILSPLLNSWFFGGELSLVFFLVAFFGAFFATLMGQSIEIFRLCFRPWPYIIISILNSALAALVILTLLLIFNFSILGYFIGIAIAAFITTIIGWYLVREYIDFTRLHYNWWPELLRFGLPLLPLGLAFYALNAMDRWFIQFYHGPETLGIYAVASQIALIMSILIETFRKAWWPISMKAMHSSDGKSTFRLIARFYIGIVCIGILTLSMLIEQIVTIMSTASFYSAADIALILVWPPLFYGFYMLVSAGLWKNKKTNLMFYIFLTAAFINLGFNQLLVPSYAGTGAAIATLISFIFLILLSLYFGEKNWNVGFKLRIYCTQISICVLSLINNFYLQIIPWYLNYPSTILILGLVTINNEERTLIFNFLKGRLRG